MKDELKEPVDKSKSKNASKDKEVNQKEASAPAISEEFQNKTSELMDMAETKHHMSHIRSMMNEKEDKMMKDDYDMDDAPVSLKD